MVYRFTKIHNIKFKPTIVNWYLYFTSLLVSKAFKKRNTWEVYKFTSLKVYRFTGLQVYGFTGWQVNSNWLGYIGIVKIFNHIRFTGFQVYKCFIISILTNWHRWNFKVYRISGLHKVWYFLSPFYNMIKNQ